MKTGIHAQNNDQSVDPRIREDDTSKNKKYPNKIKVISWGKNKITMSEQEKQLFLTSGNLISISQAAEYTPYSSEYLSLLARKGTLKAIKISRDWLTTREAVLLYVRKQERKHEKILQSFHQAEGRAI